MKKFFYMAVAAIAALSSCSSDDAFLNEDGQNVTGVTTFTATIEDEGATRTTYNAATHKAEWVAGEAISVDGHEYTAASAGASTTFSGSGATGTTHHAYFPASLYSSGTSTLPATQTYTAGEFNMPMYAESTTTDFTFNNLCAVLAVKVASGTVQKIKVVADKRLHGAFTATADGVLAFTSSSDPTKAERTLILDCGSGVTANNTTFYIAIPAQTYSYLNIYLSADGTTYKEAMATKKYAGLGAIARSTMYSINYEKNAVQLWATGPYFATMNIGATSVTDYGYYYSWGGSVNLVGTTGTPTYNTGTSELTGDNDTATKLWGINWRMPNQTDLTNLKSTTNCPTIKWQTDYQGSGKNGTLFIGTTGLSVFLPAAGLCDGGRVGGQGSYSYYWSSTPGGSGRAYALVFSSGDQGVDRGSRGYGCSVRAVLAE